MSSSDDYRPIIQTCSNSGQDHALGTGRPPGWTDSTGRDLVGCSRQPELRFTECLDPFSYCEAFQETDMDAPDPMPGDPDVVGARVAETQSPQVSQQTGARRIPCALAIRLANHSSSTAAPLATIVEQGSYSTLNSHGSLLGVGQLSPLAGVENASLDPVPQRRWRSLDGSGLGNILEDALLEDAVHVKASICKSSSKESQGPGPTCDTAATPSKPESMQPQQNPDHVPSNCTGSGGVKRFLRGVMQNVRAVSRDRPRSYLSSVEKHVQSAGDENRPQNGVQQSPSRRICPQQTFDDHQQASHPTCCRLDSPLRGLYPPEYERGGALKDASREVPRASLTPSPSLFPRPRTKEAAQEDAGNVRTGCREAVSGRCAANGREFVSGAAEFDKARDEFTSLNASFCGTMSTSYSGTVVGVDMDLQHEFAHPVCRSRSTTPVWFSRPAAEDIHASPQSKAEVTDYTVTSSALTSLLPIAAASGIVRSEYTKPLLSYYSASGRQIQRECSSTPEATPYYKQYGPAGRERVVGTPVLPPARPVVVRMKTARRKVKGCGGMVREDSLMPRSGVQHLGSKSKEPWDSRAAVRDLREAVGGHVGNAMRACFCQPKDGVYKL